MSHRYLTLRSIGDYLVSHRYLTLRSISDYLASHCYWSLYATLALEFVVFPVVVLAVVVLAVVVLAVADVDLLCSPVVVVVVVGDFVAIYPIHWNQNMNGADYIAGGNPNTLLLCLVYTQ